MTTISELQNDIHDIMKRCCSYQQVSNPRYDDNPVVVEIDGKEYNFEIIKGHRKLIINVTDQIW